MASPRLFLAQVHFSKFEASSFPTTESLACVFLAIRCHFFRKTTNPTADNESNESDTSEGETETESESEDEQSDDDVVLADLDLNP